MWYFYDWDAADWFWAKKLRTYFRNLPQDPDAIRKQFKESADELSQKDSLPADKGDVRDLKRQVTKKQESYVHVLGQRIDKLTTDVAVMRNDLKEFQSKMSMWAERVNGMGVFSYAIAKKADQFMKDRQAADPFAVVPRSAQPKPSNSGNGLGSPTDPFDVSGGASI